MQFSKFAILSFAAGVLCLQMQAHLPSLAMILLLAGVAGTAVLAGVISMREKRASDSLYISDSILLRTHTSPLFYMF